MWSMLLIACIVFQSSVAFFLLHRVAANNNFDKNLRALLLILAAHLSTKFLLLAVLKDMFLYAQVPTGFSFAYGPLLLIIARNSLGQPPMPARTIFYHYIPFLIFTLIYVTLVIAGATGRFSHQAITGYAAWYQWLAVLSLYSYPLYIKGLLRRKEEVDQPDSAAKRELASRIANVLLLSISTAFLLFTLNLTVWDVRGFDLRLLPYMCFAAIPVLVLRYRLQPAQPPATTASAVRPVSVEALTTETRLVGTPLAGTSLAGTSLAGTSLAGTSLVGTSLVDPALVGTPLAGMPSDETLPGGTSSVQNPAETPAHQNQGDLPTAGEEKPSSDRRYEKSGIDQPLMDEYEATLATFMVKSRIYLDADLSLEQLANRMKMPKHHLTQLLNERVSKSFYNYVNEYRINEAIARLNNVSAQVNILSLAFDCGFNSRSSFNNYFKKITGHTPSAYRKLQLQSPGGLNISPSE